MTADLSSRQPAVRHAGHRVADRTRSAPALPGSRSRSARPSRDGGTNFAVASASPTACCCACSTPAAPRPRSRCWTATPASGTGSCRASAPGRRTDTARPGRTTRRAGLRCNPAKLLLDPYAKAITGEVTLRAGSARATRPATPTGRARSTRPVTCRAASSSDPAFSWRDPATPAPVRGHRHLRGARQGLHDGATRKCRPSCAAPTPALATRRPSPTSSTWASPPSSCCRCTRTCPRPSSSQRGLTNYWGYNTIGYFAPHRRLLGRGARRPARRPGRRVQGHGRGPARRRSRGAARRRVQPHGRGAIWRPDALPSAVWTTPAYYRLEPDDPRRYVDTTGCGNSLNAGDPLTLQLIMDSLRYWLIEMRVDGFRFDLAPTLARAGRQLRPGVGVLRPGLPGSRGVTGAS